MNLSRFIRNKFSPTRTCGSSQDNRTRGMVSATKTSETETKSTSATTIYTPLETPQTIRILELFPGEPSDRIRCKLRNVTLEKAPPYEAISYRWGDPTKTEEVICGDGIVKVTTNLADCLRRIRSPRRKRRAYRLRRRYWKDDKPRMVWADAICINQKDAKEQGCQVKLMFEIYKRAVGLLVWLGEYQEEWPLKAFAFFEMVYGKIKESKGGYWDDEPKRYYRDYELAQLTTGDLNELDVPDWELLTRLIRNEYFERLWIYQEIGLGAGKNTKILAGVRDSVAEIQWLRLATLDPFLCYNASSLSQKWNLQATRDRIATTFHAFHDGFLPDISFVFALSKARDRKCGNPRDRIYSLISHPSARKFGPFEVNYEAPIDMVYRNFALEWMQKTKCVDILSLALYEDDAVAAKLDYPSWAPSFSEKAPKSLFVQSDYFMASKSYTARISPRSGLRVLCLAGLVLDEVATISQISKESEPQRDGESAWLVNLWDQECSMWPLDNSFEDISERFKAFLLTLGSCPIELEIMWLAKALEYWKQLSMHDLAISIIISRWVDRLSGLYESVSEEDTSDWERYADLVKERTFGRSLFYTSNGRLGLGSAKLQKGDIICVFLGGQVPYILRPEGTSRRYWVVGDCNIHNLVHGEAIDIWERGQIALEEIEIL